MVKAVNSVIIRSGGFFVVVKKEIAIAKTVSYNNVKAKENINIFTVLCYWTMGILFLYIRKSQKALPEVCLNLNCYPFLNQRWPKQIWRDSLCRSSVDFWMVFKRWDLQCMC